MRIYSNAALGRGPDREIGLTIESAASLATRLRAARNRYAPSLGKQTLLAFVNPALRHLLPVSLTEHRLRTLLRRHKIVHLDLGGWAAVEDYLTIHMSPVELYGLPKLRGVSQRQRFRDDDGACEIVVDELEAPAVTLNFDALSRLPVADGAMAGVNMSHFLEHFTLDQGAAILGE